MMQQRFLLVALFAVSFVHAVLCFCFYCFLLVLLLVRTVGSRRDPGEAAELWKRWFLRLRLLRRPSG